jgi:hypothetical protein
MGFYTFTAGKDFDVDEYDVYDFGGCSAVELGSFLFASYT